MFSRSETDRLCAEPRSPEDTSLRVCPCCTGTTVKFYYHDFGAVGSPVTRGTSWFWCAPCRKFVAYTGQSLRPEFDFNDPYSSQGEFETIESDLLNQLERAWESGELPQKFVRRR